MIVHSNLTAVRRKDLETEWKIIWTELAQRNKPTLFSVYYCPPNTVTKLPKFHRSLSTLSSMYEILLCGDFNVHNINLDTTSFNDSNSLARHT